METLLERHQGRVRVIVQADSDEWPDTSYIGTFTTWRASKRDTAVYSRETGAVLMPGRHFAWRDAHGRIMGEPDYSDDRREYQFVQLPRAELSARDAIGLARRLEALDRGDFYMMAIMARTYVDDRLVGNAVVGGYESDSDPAYIASQARELAQEAIADARQWLASLESKAS